MNTSSAPSLKKKPVILPLLRSIQNPVTALTAIHNSHGSLVSSSFFGKEFLFTCKPEHLTEIFEQEGKGLLNREFLYEAKKSLFGDGLINSKTELWTKQRRLMQPFFTKGAVAKWEKVFSEESLNTVERLKSMSPETINITQELNLLIQKIFIQILTGRSVDTIPNSDQLIESIDDISNGLLPQLVSQIISNGKLMWLMPHKKKKYEAAIKQVSDFINQEISKKKQLDEHSLIFAMNQAVDKKTGYTMTDELLKDEAITLFFAGQDTTLNVMSWFFYLIGKNKGVHEKVTAEIKQFKDIPLTMETLGEMTYTRAALYETLRLYPASASLTMQAIRDISVGGYPFPKGVTVMLSMYATHHHPDLWAKPEEFYPEHFLDEKMLSERPKHAFFPFGSGIHNCIGKHFSELEMMIIIVTLLRKFNFSVQNDIEMASSITIKPAKDVIVSVTPI